MICGWLARRPVVTLASPSAFDSSGGGVKFLCWHRSRIPRQAASACSALRSSPRAIEAVRAAMSFCTKGPVSRAWSDPSHRRQKRAGAGSPNSIAAANTAERIFSYVSTLSPSTSSRRARFSLRDPWSRRSSANQAVPAESRQVSASDSGIGVRAGSSRWAALRPASSSRAVR
ncbi:hypothetical protein [Nannocystis pusilla]|uniref:hypothetical protein n=1 Tax=Nannocystis pusilla TaxID=889268 RepID=UPI003DA5E192